MSEFSKSIITDLDNLITYRLEEIGNDKTFYDKFTDCIGIEIIENKDKNIILLKHSIKFANISFNLKNAVNLLTENALALGMSWESLTPWKVVLLIVCDLFMFASNLTVKLDDDMIATVRCLHELNAYGGVDKLTFRSKFNNASEDVLKRLEETKIISVTDSEIYLKERMLFKKTNN